MLNQLRSMFARDYLNLSNNPMIIKMLQAYNEDVENLLCFTDKVMRINKRENREERVIIATRNFVLHLKA